MLGSVHQIVGSAAKQGMTLPSASMPVLVQCKISMLYLLLTNSWVHALRCACGTAVLCMQQQCQPANPLFCSLPCQLECNQLNKRSLSYLQPPGGLGAHASHMPCSIRSLSLLAVQQAKRLEGQQALQPLDHKSKAVVLLAIDQLPIQPREILAQGEYGPTSLFHACKGMCTVQEQRCQVSIATYLHGEKGCNKERLISKL